jgi:C1A family cysteine protease
MSFGLLPAKPEELATMTHIRSSQSVLKTATLPAFVDLSPKFPAPGDQGAEGSCTAWAVGYATRGYEARKDVWANIAPTTTSPQYNFSPSYIYNQLNGGQDAGITYPAALSLVKTQGVGTLADMPYVVGQFKTQPSSAARADAAKYKSASFGVIAPNDLATMKSKLAAGYPVMIAITVYPAFLNLPQSATYTQVSGQMLGRHAITVVGYSDAKQAVEVINSWGTWWGARGYGWISYSALNQITNEAYSQLDPSGH